MKKVVILLLFSLQGFSQTITDTQLWYGTQLKLEMNKGWAISGQYRLRTIRNASYYKGSYFFLKLDKRLNDNFLVTTNYRLALVDVGVFHRFALGLEARKKINHFTLLLRPMVQYQRQNFAANDTKNVSASQDADLYFRPRLQLRCALSRRFSAYIYAEPFIKFGQQNNNGISWWQNAVGIKYEYTKNQKINLYYIRQPDYTYNKPHLFNIIGIDLEFTLKR